MRILRYSLPDSRGSGRSKELLENFGKRLFRLEVRVEQIKSGNVRRFGVGVVIPSILDASLQLV